MLCALAALACSETSAPGLVATTAVTVVDRAFQPAAITIAVGDTVTWTFTGLELHTVTFDDPTIPGSNARSLGDFQVVFGEPGSYSYYCAVHGRSVMSGSVLVDSARTPDPDIP